MPEHKALKALAWTVSITSLVVLTLGAVLVSMVVGLWIVQMTGIVPLAWVVGITIFIGFLSALGVGVGIWIWLRGPLGEDDPDTMTRILEDMSKHIPDD